MCYNVVYYVIMFLSIYLILPILSYLSYGIYLTLSIWSYLSNPTYLILSILSDLSYLIYPILSILSYPILSYPIYPIISFPILSYPVLSYPFLSYLIYLFIYLNLILTKLSQSSLIYSLIHPSIHASIHILSTICSFPQLCFFLIPVILMVTPSFLMMRSSGLCANKPAVVRNSQRSWLCRTSSRWWIFPLWTNGQRTTTSPLSFVRILSMTRSLEGSPTTTRWSQAR